MKPRFSPLGVLFALAILAGGGYACLHPAAARSSLSTLTQFVSRTAESGAHGDGPVVADAPVARHEGASSVGSSPSWGTRIADGHAFAKHGREFGFSTRAELAAHIDRVIANPSASRHLSRGRQAYWDDGTGTVVICDPSTADGGTAFKPDRGRSYYEGLR